MEPRRRRRAWGTRPLTRDATVDRATKAKSPNDRQKQKRRCDFSQRRLQKLYRLNSLGWLMGLEPTTTGITIQPSKAVKPFTCLVSLDQISERRGDLSPRFYAVPELSIPKFQAV
jgi:hypothetical protein